LIISISAFAGIDIPVPKFSMLMSLIVTPRTFSCVVFSKNIAVGLDGLDVSSGLESGGVACVRGEENLLRIRRVADPQTRHSRKACLSAIRRRCVVVVEQLSQRYS